LLDFSKQLGVVDLVEPTTYFSGVEANMRLGLYYNHPYINTYLRGNGIVLTWWNSEN
jgi:hypothetical protein